jgi:hypothetical protein
LASGPSRCQSPGGTSGFRVSRNGLVLKVIRAAPSAARTRCRNGQAVHWQAGEQLAPARHWHAEPHLQLGPHAHDAAAVWVVAPAAAAAELALLVDGFI